MCSRSRRSWCCSPWTGCKPSDISTLEGKGAGCRSCNTHFRCRCRCCSRCQLRKAGRRSRALRRPCWSAQDSATRRLGLRTRYISNRWCRRPGTGWLLRTPYQPTRSRSRAGPGSCRSPDRPYNLCCTRTGRHRAMLCWHHRCLKFHPRQSLHLFQSARAFHPNPTC